MRNIVYKLKQKQPDGTQAGEECSVCFTKTVYATGYEDRCLDACIEAISNATVVAGKTNKFVDMDNNGISWTIYKDNNGEILTAFPNVLSAE